MRRQALSGCPAAIDSFAPGSSRPGSHRAPAERAVNVPGTMERPAEIRPARHRLVKAGPRHQACEQFGVADPAVRPGTRQVPLEAMRIRSSKASSAQRRRCRDERRGEAQRVLRPEVRPSGIHLVAAIFTEVQMRPVASRSSRQDRPRRPLTRAPVMTLPRSSAGARTESNAGRCRPDYVAVASLPPRELDDSAATSAPGAGGAE
jgi:hypothetical protein